LLLKREPYKIDVPKILDAATRTGTWIELNAAPKRLDLDWRWWPMAKQKGVRMCGQPGRASRRAFAGFMVWHWRRAQRLAHERRRDELFAAGKDRERPRSEEAGVTNERSPRSRQSAGVLRYFLDWPLADLPL
jgi:Histidinol phosphatase and related hydrolases of the PHP family